MTFINTQQNFVDRLIAVYRILFILAKYDEGKARKYIASEVPPHNIGKRREKTRISKPTKALLEGSFHRNKTPRGNGMQYIIDLTGMEERNIQVWFNNKRQKDRRVQSKIIKQSTRNEQVNCTNKREEQQQQLPSGYTNMLIKQQQQQQFPIDYSTESKKQ